MPVVLEANAAGEWLAGSNELLDDVDAITPPLQAWPVDRRVNNARNEGEDLIDAVGGRAAFIADGDPEGPGSFNLNDS